MADEPSPTARASAMLEVAPYLVEITGKVLFGDVWERPGLAKRDRSLVTCAVLIGRVRPDELRFHLGLALDNGVTKEEISELITHLAFYYGWPVANTACQVAKEVFDARDG
jgi:4-carboxymuconolactone decarboxylase